MTEGLILRDLVVLFAAALPIVLVFQRLNVDQGIRAGDILVMLGSHTQLNQALIQLGEGPAQEPLA